MSQADQQVQNAAFPAVRTDINDNLAALYSQSSGASAPAVTVAFQPWIDISSSPAVWKVRNASNTGWITIGTIDATTFSTGGITAIANGGTGETTATAALAALLPSQAGNSGKALVTDGSLASWGTAGSQVTTFTGSGTWTKPSQGTYAMVYIWGGGGSGGKNSSTSTSGYTNGGGGGACNFGIFKLADLAASVTVTIGSGGAAVSTNAVSGSAGGTSSFGTLLYAYGGGGGHHYSFTGASGGSDLATGVTAGSTATAGSSLILDGGAGFARGDYGGAGTFGKAFFGGGGGGYSYISAGYSGGTSINGGDGGAGGSTTVAAVDGSVPGGGGGSARGVGNSGAGGNGLCIIYVW